MLGGGEVFEKLAAWAHLADAFARVEPGGASAVVRRGDRDEFLTARGPAEVL